jgi:hypothetical protein
MQYEEEKTLEEEIGRKGQAKESMSIFTLFVRCSIPSQRVSVSFREQGAA